MKDTRNSDITIDPRTHNQHESVLPLFAESRALSRSGALHDVSYGLTTPDGPGTIRLRKGLKKKK